MVVDIFAYPFMQRAFLAGGFIGVVCAVIGVYVVLRNLPFIGTGIAHSAFGGVALALLTGLNPLFMALVFCLAVAGAIGYTTRNGKIKEDVSIGVFFTSTMALGIVFIGFMEGYNVDIFGYLFGSILAVSPLALQITAILSVIVLSAVLLFYKELKLIVFDPEHALVTGVPETFIYYLLLSLIATTIVISLNIVGILLVSTLLVTPAAAAHQLTSRFEPMMLLAICFGLISTLGGLTISYIFNLPSGATIILLSTSIFLFTYLIPEK